MINIELTKEAEAHIKLYQTTKKIDKGLRQFNLSLAISDIIMEHKELLTENERLRKDLEICMRREKERPA